MVSTLICHVLYYCSSVNVAAVCAKEEQCTVMEFSWAEGLGEAEIHRRLLVQYGNSASL